MADPWRKYPFLTSGQAFKVDRFLMKNPWAIPAGGVILALLLIIGAYGIGRYLRGPYMEPFSLDAESEPSSPSLAPEPQTIIKTVEVKVPGGPARLLTYTGSNAYYIGGWGDNVRWDGHEVKPIDGSVEIKVNPDHNIGSVIANLNGVSINSEDRTYLDGDVRIEFTVFDGNESFMNGGLTENVELFGNSGKESDILPRVNAKLAGWGTAEVLLDGESVYSKLPAFFMVNDALRQADDAIRLLDGTIYSPKLASTGGFVDPSRQEITLMVHSTDTDKKNKPPVSVFMHLVFKEVQEGASTTVSSQSRDSESGSDSNSQDATGSLQSLLEKKQTQEASRSAVEEEEEDDGETFPPPASNGTLSADRQAALAALQAKLAKKNG